MCGNIDKMPSVSLSSALSVVYDGDASLEKEVVACLEDKFADGSSKITDCNLSSVVKNRQSELKDVVLDLSEVRKLNILAFEAADLLVDDSVHGESLSLVTHVEFNGNVCLRKEVVDGVEKKFVDGSFRGTGRSFDSAVMVRQSDFRGNVNLGIIDSNYLNLSGPVCYVDVSNESKNLDSSLTRQSCRLSLI